MSSRQRHGASGCPMLGAEVVLIDEPMASPAFSLCFPIIGTLLPNLEASWLSAQ